MTRRPVAPAEIIASERMVKGRQMRWTPRGARVLIQIRTHFLNDQLTVDFRRWYHGFTRYWIQRRSRRSLRLSRSPMTVVAYLPQQKSEMYQGCGSPSLIH
jgi:hypothetical protein